MICTFDFLYFLYIIIRVVHFAGSSNGRTAGFGPVSRGSSPCPAAKNALAGRFLMPGAKVSAV